jgi:hypothetical protein
MKKFNRLKEEKVEKSGDTWRELRGHLQQVWLCTTLAEEGGEPLFFAFLFILIFSGAIIA